MQSVNANLLERAGERAGGQEELDEQQLMLLWDCFVLEHKLAGGRTVVEQLATYIRSNRRHVSS